MRQLESRHHTPGQILRAGASNHNAKRRRRRTPLSVLGAVSVAIAFASSIALSAPDETRKPTPSKTSSAKATSPEAARAHAEWHKALSRLPQPKEGCYTASYPRVEWKPTVCGPPPPYPLHPARGHAKHFVVGGGGSNDFAANPNATGPFGTGSSTVFSADGTFVSLSAGNTEAGQFNATGGQISDTYSLQLNTNFFTSPACAGSPNANCRGWEQFVYENNTTDHRVFIQYWLIQYNTTCPAGGWNQFSFSGDPDIYCFRSTTTASLTAGQPASNLGNMTLTGAASTGSDQVTITAGPNAATRVGLNLVAASSGWTDAEFNVFGDAGGGQANFGASTTMVARTMVHNGTRNPPNCRAESFTGETNNLTLLGMSPIGTQPSPAIEFTQSNVPGSMAACVTAAGFGDTHLSTFGGLLYDFQASGDFVLAQTDEDFIVEARQVSGAPTWPNASVNKAVATRMGDTRVAFCTAPSRLMVDGTASQIAEGETLSLASGVDILRTGNVYVVVGQSGNGLRAELNDTYINATVGLGRWPAKVRGLLANVDADVNKIASRSGAVLSAPFAFVDLYHGYADSWRVPEKESLLSVCGDREVETGIPKRPFYAQDLDRQTYKRARAVCTAAGVKVKSLLDACTLDVAVTGKETAAKVFVGLRPPAAVGHVVSKRGDRGGDYGQRK